jgi:hypothetical protein
MISSPGATGFEQPSASAAPSGLAGAVAASLAIGSISLCLIVTLTVLSTRVSIATPDPAYVTISSPAPASARHVAAHSYGAAQRGASPRANPAHDHS